MPLRELPTHSGPGWSYKRVDIAGADPAAFNAIADKVRAALA